MLAKRGVPRVFGAGRPTRPGADEPAIADTRGGLIFGGEPRTRCAAEDGSVRLNLWLPERLLRRRLEVLLDGQNVESVAFQPVFDQTRGAGATIRRMLDFLFVELEHSELAADQRDGDPQLRGKPGALPAARPPAQPHAAFAAAEYGRRTDGCLVCGKMRIR